MCVVYVHVFVYVLTLAGCATARVSVGITVDAPVTAVWNKTNDIQYFKDI